MTETGKRTPAYLQAVVLFMLLLFSIVSMSQGESSTRPDDAGAKSIHHVNNSSDPVQAGIDPVVKPTADVPVRSKVGAPGVPGHVDRNYPIATADNNTQGISSAHNSNKAMTTIPDDASNTVSRANLSLQSSTTTIETPRSLNTVDGNTISTTTAATTTTTTTTTTTVTTTTTATASFSPSSSTSSSSTKMQDTSVPTTTSSTRNDSNTNPSSRQTGQCPEMCTCPDYEAWSAYLLPDLRRLMGSAVDNYTDDVLKLFLLRQFLTDEDSPKSVLFLLVVSLLASGRSMQGIGLQWAREGVTNCHLRGNDTFYLDAAAEAKLFPQVAYKVAQEKASVLTEMDTQDNFPREASTVYKGSQLYNISFTCSGGGKVVVTKQASLYRYGRWQNSRCDISTEGHLTLNRNLSLVELIVGNATASWLQNITVVDERKNSTDSHPYNNASVSSNNTGMVLNRRTMFPSVRQVRILFTSISVGQLSSVLAWFQKTTELSLIYNDLGDFNCSQLLPSPAAWRRLTVVRNGLKAVPACILRQSLVALNLSNNAISDISVLQYPRAVPAPDMQSLVLSDNKISDLGILSDMNLTLLYLDGNMISSLNKLSFNRLPSLSHLDLSRNQLHQLDPGSFKSLVNLMHLDLSNNRLQQFERSVSPLRVYPSLVCHIFLQNNSLSHPPFASNAYDPGKNLLVHSVGNPFACDCDMVDYVSATDNSSLAPMYVDRADMLCAFPASMAGVPVGQVAFGQSCPVVSHCPPGCACLLSHQDGVVTVDCSAVEDFQLPQEAPAVNPLRLEFQGQSDRQTQLSFQDSEYLQRVVTFNVSGRGLTAVPDFLCEALPMASLLDVSHNHLQRLPLCFHNRSQLWPPLELRLGGNPWSCDCEAASFSSWLATMRTGQQRDGMRVSDVEDVWCSDHTQPGVRVADWDSSHCDTASYLPWAVALGVTLGLALLLGPLLYVYRLHAMVAIHAHLHVRPFAARHRFAEEDYEYEALVVHGASDLAVDWVSNVLLPRAARDSGMQHQRLCVPGRDFLPGCVLADALATAVARAKCTVCLLSREAARDEWWLYAFQMARAENARRPHVRLLLVLLEHAEEADLPEEVRGFLKSNTYLDVKDGWFWKKLCYYMPDPPKEV